MINEVTMRGFSIDKSQWKKVKFGEVVFEPKESVKNPTLENIQHVVGLDHMDSEDVHLRRSASIEGSTTFTKRFSKGDVLFGRRRAYLKKAALSEFGGICSGDIIVMRAQKSCLLPGLLPYLVNNNKFFDYAITHSAGGLSPRVKFEALSTYELRLPGLPEQEKLLELFISLDDLNEKQRILQQKAQATLEVLLENKLVKLEAKDYPRKSLDKLINIKHGFPFKSEYWAEDDKSLPVAVAIGNYEYTGGFRFNSSKVKCYSGDYPKEYELEPGDLLLAMTCQTPGGEILGIPGVIEDDGRTYLHNQRIGLVEDLSRGSVLMQYLYLLFLTKDFRRFLFSSASGTKVLHTSPSKIGAYEFYLPPVSYQKDIVSEFAAIFKAQENVALALASNRLIRSGLNNQVF